MGFSSAHLIQLKKAVSIVQVFQALGYESIVRPGLTLCVFHEDHKPSLLLHHDYFWCFSSACGVHGDIFSLVMLSSKCSFPQAVRFVEGLC